MSLIRPADCIGCQLWASGHKERFTETKRARGQPLWTNTNTASPGRTAACRQKKICSCQSASQFVCLDGIIRPQKATEQHCHFYSKRWQWQSRERTTTEKLQQPRIVLWACCMKGHRNKKPQQEVALSNFHLLFQICLCLNILWVPTVSCCWLWRSI